MFAASDFRNKHALSAYDVHVLQEAINNGNLECAESLLLNGDNPNRPDHYGFTPLFIAACDGHLDAVKMLLKYGAIANKALPSKCTPLYAACSEGHTDVVLYLIESGASIDRKTCDRSTPLHAACSEGHSEVAHILILAGADIHAVDDEGCTPLCYAAKKGDFNSVQLLVESGANVGHKSYKTGFTALHEVCKNFDNVEMVQYLVERGADVHQADSKNMTALHYAAEGNYYSTAKYLISQGAEPNAIGIENKTPLMLACHLRIEDTEREVSKARDLVELLIESGADTNIRTTNGNTGLHLLLYKMMRVKYKHSAYIVDMMNMFLRAGSHLDIPDFKRRTLLDYIGWAKSGMIWSANDSLSRFVDEANKYIPVPLRCLCARVVNENDLLNARGNDRLTEYFTDFINIHQIMS